MKVSGKLPRTYIFLAAVLVIAAAAGCTSPTDTGDGTGSFQLLVSDQPSEIENFDSLVVTFDRARVFGPVNATDGDEGDGNETDDGFQTFDISGESVDLTQVTGTRATQILNTTLEEGRYTKVELYTSDTDATVDGETVDVMVPSEKLMITKNFNVNSNATTRFVFDIQVVRKGTGGYNLLPVISESGVAGEDVEVEEVEPDIPAEAGNGAP